MSEVPLCSTPISPEAPLRRRLDEGVWGGGGESERERERERERARGHHHRAAALGITGRDPPRPSSAHQTRLLGRATPTRSSGLRDVADRQDSAIASPSSKLVGSRNTFYLRIAWGLEPFWFQSVHPND